MYSEARLQARLPPTRPLGRVTLFPSAFGAGEDDRESETRPCARVGGDGVSLEDVFTGQRFASVGDFVEAASVDYVRQLNGMNGSGLLEAAQQHARAQAEAEVRQTSLLEEKNSPSNSPSKTALSSDKARHAAAGEDPTSTAQGDAAAWGKNIEITSTEEVNMNEVVDVLDKWDDGVPAL